jgi:hypothetical protein
MKYIYLGLIHSQNADIQYADNEMYSYNLVVGKVYVISGTSGLFRYIGTIDNDIMHRISKRLVDIYFKPLDEVRNNKISEILA